MKPPAAVLKIEFLRGNRVQPLLILWGLIIIALGVVVSFISLDRGDGTSSSSHIIPLRWGIRFRGVFMLLVGSGLLMLGIRG